MFVIILSYQKDISEVDKYLIPHREFLEQGYQKNYFLTSGPQNPRTGGIIISLLKDKKQLEELMAKDPFQIHGIASYELIEFSPVKFHQNLADLV